MSDYSVKFKNRPGSLGHVLTVPFSDSPHGRNAARAYVTQVIQAGAPWAEILRGGNVVKSYGPEDVANDVLPAVTLDELYHHMTAAWRHSEFAESWRCAASFRARVANGETVPRVDGMHRNDVLYYVDLIHRHYGPNGHMSVVTQDEPENVRATIDPPTSADPMACAANGIDGAGRPYHYDPAHNGYVYDSDVPVAGSDSDRPYSTQAR